MFRKTVIYSIILLLISFGFIGWNLYLMEIEDHYGDLQEVYFESQNGDLILNKQTKKIGVISKDWKRVNVITTQNDTLDLYVFVNQDKFEILRSETKLNLSDLNFDKVSNLKNEKLIKSILTN